MIITFGWGFSGVGIEDAVGGCGDDEELAREKRAFLKWDWFCFGKDGLRVLLEFIGTAWRGGFNLGIVACTIGLLC